MLPASRALAECGERGLIVRSERELARRAGSRHWHLGFPGRPGTLELNEWQGRVWVKVHSLRDGGDRARTRTVSASSGISADARLRQRSPMTPEAIVVPWGLRLQRQRFQEVVRPPLITQR